MDQEIESIQIEELVPHPDNPRRGDVPAIMRSLERFGQMKPVIVQKTTRYIVAGNHTVQAAKRLGWTTVQAVVMDIDDAQAKAYLIADNVTSDRSTYDKAKKAELYGSLLGDETLQAMGIADEFEQLAEELYGKREPERQPGPRIELEDRESDDEPEPNAPEPMREIPLRMATSTVQEFGAQVVDLQNLWKATTLVDIVLRSVREAHERYQAGVGVAGTRPGSREALPEELVSKEF